MRQKHKGCPDCSGRARAERTTNTHAIFSNLAASETPFERSERQKKNLNSHPLRIGLQHLYLYAVYASLEDSSPDFPCLKKTLGKELLKGSRTSRWTL